MTPKERIKKELLRQLGESDYREITITALASSLNMSRQNLYKHFASREEILRDLIQDQLELFFDVFEAFYDDQSTEKWLALSRRLLEVIRSNETLIIRILEADTEKLVFDNLKAAVKRALGHVARINGIAINDQAFLEILALHIAGSTYHAGRYWVLEGRGVPMEKMAEVLADLLNDDIVAKLKQCAYV